MKKKARQHYKFVADYTERREPLTASFEIDGKVFITDKATLNLLNQKLEKGSPQVAHWLFAVNLATGRIKRTQSTPAVE